MSFDHDVYEAHRRTLLTARLFDLFLPGGNIRNIEGPMWDYKIGYCHPRAALQEDSVISCELLHAVASFYNAFGGYLIIAYQDADAAKFAKFVNKEDFEKLCDRYLRAYIPIVPFSTRGLLGDQEVNFLFIHVGKRKEPPPIYYKRNSAKRADGTYVFKAEGIPFRFGSNTLTINDRTDLIVFAFSERKADIGEIPSPLNEIDNNLPPRDPNLIEFIGRREYLTLLWNWLVDLRNPVKVLTALGGTGKTAIAYEFCEQLIKSRSDAFAKVVWLTAKSQTYAAILQKYVTTTRTDFTDIDSFLDAFLREIGCLEADFEDLETIDDKLDFAKELVKDVAVLLVIDDLDSLDQDKQIELYSRIAQLFDQALSSKCHSKVLFTSRLEPNAGVNRIIKIAGFSREETVTFADSLVKHLGGSDSWGIEVNKWIDAIFVASRGSPIFIASILRLVSFGDSVEAVITNWKEKDGEEVRRFAFKREIESLSYKDWRTLYVLQMLSATTFEELRELLREERPRLQGSLLRLSQFHLFAGNANPATGAEISVPEPIRLMVKITEESLLPDDAEELRRRCARVTRAVDWQSEAGIAVRGISLLWRRQKYPEALVEAQRAAKRFPRSGEISFALGRTLLLQTPPDFEAADDAFKDAQIKKYARPHLLEYWSLTKLKKGDIQGLIRLTAGHLVPDLSGVALLYRLAGIYRLARNREDQVDHATALTNYQKLMDEVMGAIKEARTDPVAANVNRLASAVPNYIIDCAYRVFKRDSIDRIFFLAVDLARAGYPPMHQIERLLSDLNREVSGRASHHKGSTFRSTLRRRIDGLQLMRRALMDQLGDEHIFVRAITRTLQRFAMMH